MCRVWFFGGGYEGGVEKGILGLGRGTLLKEDIYSACTLFCSLDIAKRQTGAILIFSNAFNYKFS